MKQKIFNSIKLFFLTGFAFILLSPSAVLAVNYTDGVVTKVTSNLTSDQSPVLPKKNITLTFSISKNTGSICPTGLNLYNNIEWFQSGTVNDTDIKYVQAGTGSTAIYTFYSGEIGQKNAYDALFYCSTTQIDKSVLYSARGQLMNTSPPKAWVTDSFGKTTEQQSTQTYGCKAANGIYACSTDPASTAIAACPKPVQQLQSCWCGKTEAQVQTQCGSTNPTPTPSSGASIPTDHLINPLPTDNLLATFLNITRGFLAVLGVWAVIAIIIAGFRMVVAAGNEEAIAVAKKSITWAVIGLVVALLSFSIVTIVLNILNVDPSKFNPGTINPSSYIQQNKIV